MTTLYVEHTRRGPVVPATIARHVVRKIGPVLAPPLFLTRERIRGDEYAARLIARVRASAGGRDGVAAFLEKRRARWVEERDA